MVPEVADLYALLQSVHESVDQMVQDLTDEQWLTKPLPNFNNVASVIDHITRVEKKFFSGLAGESLDIDTQAPFKAESWDLNAIRHDWSASLPYAAQVLENVKEEELSQLGLRLRVGELNKRQLIAYAIAHAAHHRGQIPLIKKLLIKSE